MIAAIMQPYFFPYIGYFQLMHAVDTFVFFDDVQYIDRGWVNRNRIRNSDGTRWLTLPVHKASRDLWINQRHYILGHGDAWRDVERKLTEGYRGFEYFDEAMQVVSESMACDNDNVAVFNANLLTRTARRLGVSCEFVSSSEIVKPSGLRAQAKVVDLCKRLGASRYLNPIGGLELYDPKGFESEGIELSFIRTTTAQVALSDGDQFLSIIDNLMTDGIAGSSMRLGQYEILNRGNP